MAGLCLPNTCAKMHCCINMGSRLLSLPWVSWPLIFGIIVVIARAALTKVNTNSPAHISSSYLSLSLYLSVSVSLPLSVSLPGSPLWRIHTCRSFALFRGFSDCLSRFLCLPLSPTHSVVCFTRSLSISLCLSRPKCENIFSICGKRENS